jgi:hypothetical protein
VATAAAAAAAAAACVTQTPPASSAQPDSALHQPPANGAVPGLSSPTAAAPVYQHQPANQTSLSSQLAAF